MNHYFYKNSLLIISWWFLFSLLALALVKPVFAQEEVPITQQVTKGELVFEDNFSSGNLDKWEPVRDDGSLWSIVDGKAQANIAFRSTITELVPKDEFWNTDWKNISYSYKLTPYEGVDKNTSFGWESPGRWFEIHFTQGLMNLVRREENYVPINLFKVFEMENGKGYQIEIRLIDQTIGIYIDGVLLVETTYEDYVSQGGKIGLKAGTGGVAPTRIQYDNVKVHLLEKVEEQQPSNQVPLISYKQTDPQWATDGYDHATNWSANPTMSRWGCLVSSIAMVMNYHGMTTLVDGTPLTPATLNDWLKTQPDGFVGEGLVMWSAVTRLTRQLSDEFGTPKLEYSRIAGNDLQPTIDAISQMIPTILQVEGHFVAGSGFTEDKQDLLIEDPSYNYTQLSQHDSDLLSTRLLTPSFTDLSYIYVMHDPNVNAAMVDENGNELTTVETFTEQLSEDGGNQVQELHVSQIAKPSSGEYFLQVQNNETTSFDLTIFAYDDEANLTDLSIKNIDAVYPFTLKIEYFKTAAENTTTIEQVQNAC